MTNITIVILWIENIIISLANINLFNVKLETNLVYAYEFVCHLKHRVVKDLTNFIVWVDLNCIAKNEFKI